MVIPQKPGSGHGQYGIRIRNKRPKQRQLQIRPVYRAWIEHLHIPAGKSGHHLGREPRERSPLDIGSKHRSIDTHIPLLVRPEKKAAAELLVKSSESDIPSAVGPAGKEAFQSVALEPGIIPEHLRLIYVILQTCPEALDGISEIDIRIRTVLLRKRSGQSRIIDIYPPRCLDTSVQSTEITLFLLGPGSHCHQHAKDCQNILLHTCAGHQYPLASPAFANWTISQRPSVSSVTNTISSQFPTAVTGVAFRSNSALKLTGVPAVNVSGRPSTSG